MSFANEFKSWLSPKSPGGQMALLLAVGSLVVAASNAAFSVLVLQPSAVINELMFWQLITHAFLVAPSPLSIVFGILILLQTGSWLEAQWGRQRVWVFVLTVNVVAGAVTVLVALVSARVLGASFFGGYTTIAALWVAQGLIIGPGRISWFGFPVSGYAFAAIGAAFTLFAGLTGSWVAVLPQLVGLLVTVAWVQGYTPSRLWLRFRSNQLNRELRRRASHLSVVKSHKNDPNHPDYLN